MRIATLAFLLLNMSLVACADYDSETAVETEVISSEEEVQSNVENQLLEGEEEPLLLVDASLQKAYDSFLAQGVPVIPLTRTLNFYRDNRASTGGLKDTSCLKKPMSETGAIAKNSNRYDPTTLALLKVGIRNERYIMIVDFTQSNLKSRGYLLDMQPNAQGQYTVTKMLNAHGYGSKAVDGIPTVFTNSSGNGTTVSGFHITASVTYPFYGTSGGKSYNSMGLRLYGLDSTNNTAESTSKVAHGAPYVTDSRAGNSAGCPAMKPTNAEKWLPVLKGGILWYHHTKINNSLTYKAPSC